jgi:hypothetical protein
MFGEMETNSEKTPLIPTSFLIEHPNPHIKPGLVKWGERSYLWPCPYHPTGRIWLLCSKISSGLGKRQRLLEGAVFALNELPTGNLHVWPDVTLVSSNHAA